MLTDLDETDGERVLTARIPEATIDAETVGDLESALDEVERAAIENLVLRFSAPAESVIGDFPSWQPGPGRPDMRYFARWDETLARLSRLQAKTFVAYDGRVGAAAVHLGLVVDLRLASVRTRLSLGGLAEGRFPGLAAFWLPKFVGLGVARRIFLLGAELAAEHAARLGLVDVVDETVEAAIGATVKALRPVTPEAACFSRRLLDDSYLLERGAAVELTKAARYRIGRE